jgi:very-short-patch-repair endonuclease
MVQSGTRLSTDVLRALHRCVPSLNHGRMDPRSALRTLGGAARRDAVIAAGVTGDDLRAALMRGEVMRPHFGTYALPGVPRDLVVAASMRGQLACVSACAWWGLKSIATPDAPHVLVPLDRHPRPERLSRLRLQGVHRDEAFVPGRNVQPIDIAIDHAAWCTTPLEQLVIVNSALYSRRIDPLEVPQFTKGSTRRLEWLRWHATGLTQSVPENVAFAALKAAGLNPRPQASRDRVGAVDFAVGARHVVEIDGYETHSEKAQFAEDRRRDREISAMRNWSLRYTYWDVMDDPLGFALDVARVIGRPAHNRLQARIRWMTTLPDGHLNRRHH